MSVDENLNKKGVAYSEQQSPVAYSEQHTPQMSMQNWYEYWVSRMTYYFALTKEK